MSNTTPLPTIDPTAYIRTFVPLAVGALLGWLVTTYTAVGSLIAWLDTALATLMPGVNLLELLQIAAVALVTAAYYWGARQLGRKWPAVERWLLGSAATPTYTLPPTR